MPTLTREEAYELVWATPMRELAQRFSMSDVGLKKALSRLDVPIPPQGHWNKVKAGKPVIRIRLPLRGPGMPLSLALKDNGNAADPYRASPWDPSLVVQEPEPLPPAFNEDLVAVESRVATALGRVKHLRDFSSAHPLVRRLLAKDEERRRKQAGERWLSDWYAPYFESAFEQRRLKLLNSILLGLRQFGGGADTRGPKARDLTLTIGARTLQFWLDHPEAKPNRHGEWETRAGKADQLKLVVGSSWTGKNLPSWQDEAGNPLENQLSAIVLRIITLGEAALRQGALDEHAWKLKRREDARIELAERERKAQEAAERASREKVAAARERLLSAASEHRAANDIRALVAAAQSDPFNGELRQPIETWSRWAHTVADELDPMSDVESLIST